ncbi:MAG: SWIM zinc finger family protein, partial [Anaerolineae bacterium]|nr:SWIM zinc finger family protein [Anaerolineae bacterium]
ECADSIESLVELLQGRLSKGVMERICRPQTGLFPSPKEIAFDCSCPDWAVMCKHVAAVFYGIGARLDEQPELLFTLRRVDARELVAQAGAGLPLKRRKAPAAARVLDDASLADVFGIEMALPAAPAKRAKTAGTKKKPPAVKKTASPRKAVAVRKSESKRKTSAASPARSVAAKASSTGKKARIGVSRKATRKKASI